MDGVRLDDVKRAIDARDPGLAALVVALTNAPDEVPDEPLPEGALTYAQFTSELRSWRFMYKSDEEKKHYRLESFKELEENDRLPDRLWLHEIVMGLWERRGAYEREQLLEIIATCPLKWGPWKALKQIFKDAEAAGDTEIMGALSARLDATRSGYYFYSEVTQATLTYMVRRAWRYLRRMGQTFPSRYADAAVDFLKFYPEDTNWNRTWVANHIFFHETRRYGQASFNYWSLPNSLIEKRAFPEAWQRTPRPLFTLLEQANSEKVRTFAITALKEDFRTVLREVEASWVARLAYVESASAHEFIVWLLKNVPKFEQASFREMGLHEALLLLLDSPSNDARTYAAEYARTYARDLDVNALLRLANNNNNNVRKLAFDLLRELDPRKEVGLDAWGLLLGTYHGHKTAEEALRKHFGASELTPAWFRERLLSDESRVVDFAKDQLLKVHPANTLGATYFTSLFDEERLEWSTSSFALQIIIENYKVEDIDEQFWRRSLLHPLSSSQVRTWIEQEKVKARAFGVSFWRALAYHPTWEEDTWVAELKASERPWAKNLDFNESLAGFARGILGDVRQFSPSEVGFDWLMELVQRLESHYHSFAESYMLKAFVPADFAPANDDAEADEDDGSGGDADLGEATFLFTGKLATMTRKEAQKKVTDAGGKNAKSVVASLDYLVVGDEGSPLFGQGKKGSKMVKAEKLQSEGSAMRIISETAFLQMLAGEVREVSADQTEAGCERLWEMATGEGDGDEPLRHFALKYLRHHHLDLGPALTERQVDPGAEVPREFYTFERFLPLFSEDRLLLRKFARDIGRWELVRWSPSLHDVVELCEQPYADVTRFFEEALLAPEIKETERYRLGRDLLTVDGVYRFCESLDKGTRGIGMALIAKYPDLAEPSALFRLTESPDRQVRAFVIRTIWSLYRDRGITLSWRPTEVEHRYSQAKTKKGLQDYETGPGPAPRPESWPAPEDELQRFLRRILFEIPPAKLSRDEAPGTGSGQEGEQQADGSKRPKRVRPIPARVAKISLIEVMRDLALEDEAFAVRVAPLLSEFMRSRGKSEQSACLVALARMARTYPEKALLPTSVEVVSA